MSPAESAPLTRELLFDYFRQAAKPSSEWSVGMELERMGRAVDDGGPLPYDGEGPSVLAVLRELLDRRGGRPIYEAERLIGVDGDWGTITLEPGGQVEWSSRPRRTLAALERDLDDHLASMASVADALRIRWLHEAVEPELPVEAMPWMPKARYAIMGPFLGRRGRLAHRMMTQTASIQCAYDYADPDDWRRKFKAAALLAPLATALFANSSRIDGADSGYVSYRQRIWRETDPDRCGLPPVVFEPRFDLERWLDWILQVPTIFLHRSRGLVPAGGVRFAELLERTGCTRIKPSDWGTHISTIFTDVRSYTYIEVRSADALPDPLVFAVPSFWTGLLYDATALDAALDLGAPWDDARRWAEAMEIAAREGLAGRVDGRTLAERAREALDLALGALGRGAPCAGDDGAGARALARLAEARRL